MCVRAARGGYRRYARRSGGGRDAILDGYEEVDSGCTDGAPSNVSSRPSLSTVQRGSHQSRSREGAFERYHHGSLTGCATSGWATHHPSTPPSTPPSAVQRLHRPPRQRSVPSSTPMRRNLRRPRLCRTSSPRYPVTQPPQQPIVPLFTCSPAHGPTGTPASPAHAQPHPQVNHAHFIAFRLDIPSLQGIPTLWFR